VSCWHGTDFKSSPAVERLWLYRLFSVVSLLGLNETDCGPRAKWMVVDCD